MNARYSIVASLCVTAGCTAFTDSVFAQGFPNRPIRIVVAFSAGGANDAVARTLGQRLADVFGQQVIIDNRPGANGNIGAEFVAKSRPDGYTTLMAFDATMAINPWVFKKPPFDSVRDFAPIGKVDAFPLILVAHPSLPANSMKELIALAMRSPGIDYSSAGHASTGHLSMILMQEQARIQLTHIAYKGGSQALVDTIGGQIPMLITAISTAQAHFQTGKLKPLGVTSAKRHPSAPGVPAFAEAGLPGYNVVSWHGLVAPAGTPKEVIARLNVETVKALATPEMKERFAALGFDPAGSTPEHFAAEIKADLARWGEIVKRTGLRAE